MLVAFWNSHKLMSLYLCTVVYVQNQPVVERCDSDVDGVLERPKISHSMPEYTGVYTDTFTEITINRI